MTHPGRLFLLSSLAVASFASLLATPPANAQKWLSWRGSPAAHGHDVMPAAPAMTPAVLSKPNVVTTPSAEPARSVEVPKAAPVPSVPTPEHANVAVSTEPVPVPSSSIKTETLVSTPPDTVVADAPVTSQQEGACDEIIRCDRLEVVRSGVGVEAPKDEAVKRRPENAAKRNVLQSVRSVW